MCVRLVSDSPDPRSLCVEDVVMRRVPPNFTGRNLLPFCLDFAADVTYVQ
jgi:hypothetical protein